MERDHLLQHHLVDSTRAGEHTWGMEKRVSEDEWVGMRLFGGFCLLKVVLLFFRNSIVSKV